MRERERERERSNVLAHSIVNWAWASYVVELGRIPISIPSFDFTALIREDEGSVPLLFLFTYSAS